MCEQAVPLCLVPLRYVCYSWSTTVTHPPAPSQTTLPAQPPPFHQCLHAQSLNHVQLFTIPWTVAHQTPLSMGFPRQEYWSRLPFPPPGDLPDPGTEPTSPTLAGGFFTTEPPGKPLYQWHGWKSKFWILSHLIFSSLWDLQNVIYCLWASSLLLHQGLIKKRG